MVSDVEGMKADRDLFEKLYQEYHLMLFRSAYLMTGSRYDAEDITQDTFITAVQHIGELRDPSKVRTWLYRIMTNLAHRKYARGVRETASDDVTELADADPESGNPLDPLPGTAQRLDLENALMQLDPRRRDVMVLYYYNGLSVHEIARICGCLEGTVKSRLYKGRKELKSMLAPDEEPHEGKERKVPQHA